MTKPLDPIEATTATRAGRSGAPAAPEPAPRADATHDAPAQDGHGHDSTCANCGTALAGEYCHHCGQYAHNPLTSFKHAVEDVFESFWHLDGRIFRTLRDLFVPGRVALNYLAGHRVRYIPPLRLFVILSLLTFFVGKLVLHVEPAFNMGGEALSFETDRSVADVERHRDRLLTELKKDEAEAATTPGVNTVLVATRARIEGQAAARINQLRMRGGAATQGTGDATPASSPAGGNAPAAPPGTSPADDAGGDASATDAAADRSPDCDALVAQSRQAAWVPGFVADWVKARFRRGCENFKHVDTEGGRLFQQFLAAVPTALFLLMPIFALLLKVCFLGTGRSYLEHMVVALYSHCFLLLMLLALFLLAGLNNIGAPGWLQGMGNAAVWLFIPIYLWLMQRRVYGGGWWINALRYVVIGWTYVVLVSFATAFAALQGISS